MTWRPGDNPFPGFRPFEEDESDRFFGRREATYELVDRLGERSFLAVLGGSGSGKSSLVKCGLLPALQRGLLGKAGSAWRVARVRPRNDPLGRLARGLAEAELVERDGSLEPAAVIEAILRRDSYGLSDLAAESDLGPRENLLVFVDQFEELFRYRDNIRERGKTDDDVRFVKLLLEAARRTRGSLEGDERPLEHRVFVLITMRSDFLGDCAGYHRLVEWINRGFFLVPFPTREERREAIEGPVALAGAGTTSRLVHRFLNDTGEDPARLPVLQHALMRTWDAWAKRTTGFERDGGFKPSRRGGSSGCDPEKLDLCDYESAGGVDGALDQHLSYVLEGLGDDQRPCAEGGFRRLTEALPDGRAVRRATTFAALQQVTGARPADIASMIDAFRAPGRTFLTPPAGERLEPHTLIDISHESLIPNWRALRTWMAEEAERARVYRALTAAAADFYSAAGRSKYRDPELQEALNWRRSWESEEKARTWAEPYDRGETPGGGYDRAMSYLSASRQARSLRRGLAAAGIGLFLAGIAGWGAFQRAAAFREERGRVMELANTLGQTDPLEGVLVLTGLADGGDVDGRGLRTGIELAERAIPTAQTHLPGVVRGLEVDATAQRALVITESPIAGRVARVVSTVDGRVVEEPSNGLTREERDRLRAAAFSGLSGVLVLEDGAPASTASSTVQSSGWPRLTVPIPADFAQVSSDQARFLAVYPEDGAFCVWDLTRIQGAVAPGCGVANRIGHPDIREAWFTSDGAHAVAWGFDDASVWRVTDRRQIGQTVRTGDQVQHASYDADSGNLVVGAGRNATVWDPEALAGSGRPCALPHDAMVVRTLARGDTVWTVARDGVARRWDFPRDATGCGDATRPDEILTVAFPGQTVEDIAVLEGGTLLRVATDDGVVRVWCAAQGAPPCDGVGALRRVLAGHQDTTFIRFDAATKQFVTADRAGGLRVWRLEGTHWYDVVARPSPALTITAIASDPVSGRVAVGYRESVPGAQAGGRVHVFDNAATADGTRVGPITDLPLAHPVAALAYDPTGRRLAVGSGDRVLVWGRGRSAPRELPQGAPVIQVGFDGPIWLLSVTADSVITWDADSGQRRGEAVSITPPARTARVGPRGLVVTGSDRVSIGDDRAALVQLWVGADSDTVLRIPDRSPITDVSVSPDGKHVAAVTGLSLWWASRVEDREGTAWDSQQIVERARHARFLSDSTLLYSRTARGIHALRVPEGDPLYAFHGELQALQFEIDALSGRAITWTLSGEVDELRAWPLEWDGMIRRLRAVTQACLDADQRRRLFSGVTSGTLGNDELCTREGL